MEKFLALFSMGYIFRNFLYPQYEVYRSYRGYIVFAFFVIMFVCLFVNFFLSKISQQLLHLGL